jgi:hypothetical protein
MPKFPRAPTVAELQQSTPALHILQRGALVWRIYFRAGTHPGAWNRFRTFGPVAGGRFDHHQPPARDQERAILYAAGSGPACVAEVFQHNRLVDRVAWQPTLVAFTLQQPLRLLDLTGPWATAVGASMALSSGTHSRAQGWSRAFYDAFADAQGLWYPSSMYGGQHALALYERARPAVAELPLVHRSLDDVVLDDLIFETARQIGYELRNPGR